MKDLQPSAPQLKAINGYDDKLSNNTNQFLSVRLDVTHIWFAMCKNKPRKPVYLTESGFLLHLKNDTKG